MCVMRTYKNSAFWPFLALAVLALSVFAARAQEAASDYPSQTIRIVVGFTPGGAPDITARVIAQKINELWKRPVIVENRPGAGSEVAARYVAQSAPDGYTLLSITNAHAVAPAIDAHLPYDASADFAAIGMTSMAPNWVLVAPTLNIHSLSELVAFAKAHPNQLNFGSAGVGSFMHFAAAMFNSETGIEAQHVPYKGPPEALTETVAGRVQYVVSPIGAALGLVRDGKLIPVAVTGNKPLAEFPDVPTVSGPAYPGFELWTWTGFLAPAHTPPAIIDKLNAAIAEILKQPDVQAQFQGISVQPMASTPAQFQQRIADAITEYTAAARKADITVK